MKGSGFSVAFALSCSLRVQAATLVPPRDLGELLRASDLAVLARADSARTQGCGALLCTTVSFAVEAAITGGSTPQDPVRVATPGGESDGLGCSVAGSPRFVEGHTYLLFLQRAPTGVFRPLALSYGILERVSGPRGSLLVPIASSRQIETRPRPDGRVPEPVGSYREPALLAHLAEVAAGVPWNSSGVLAAPEDLPGVLKSEAAAGDCSLSPANDGNPTRWFDFDAGLAVSMSAQVTGDPSLPGGGFAELRTALANWVNIPGTSVNDRYGGTSPFTPNCAPGASHTSPPPNNVVIFDDPCSDNAAGALAIGGTFYQVVTEPFQGAPWHRIVGWFIVVSKGTGEIGPVDYVRMLTHELGHGLGRSHTSDPESVMQPFCCNDIGNSDVTCLQQVYPAALSPAPSPDFTIATSLPAAGRPIGFAASSAGGAPISWSWDFGDGAVSAEQSPTHTFAAPGIYPVALTETNAAGTKTLVRSVIVNALRHPQPPVSRPHGTHVQPRTP
jgi:PKD repeat protein